MNLDEIQKQKVAAWIAAGLKLSEIQKKLEVEFGLRLTYLEARLLVDDLKLVPVNPAPPKPPEITTQPAASLAPAPAASAVAGKVSVTVDRVARPGALVSGGVTFSDGQPATWYLDEQGRLGLAPQQSGYKPAIEDVQSFQRELQIQLQKAGF
jgi:hypothetical protein